MNPTLQTRIEVDKNFAVHFGTAMYIFAYYEKAVISILDVLQPGFVNAYSRTTDFSTFSKLIDEFEKIIENCSKSRPKTQTDELKNCCAEFKKQVKTRNTLIHAHPAAPENDSQVLIYQGAATRPIADMKWSCTELKKVVYEFDAAACEAARIHDCLRKPKDC